MYSLSQKQILVLLCLLLILVDHILVDPVDQEAQADLVWNHLDVQVVLGDQEDLLCPLLQTLHLKNTGFEFYLSLLFQLFSPRLPLPLGHPCHL